MVADIGVGEHREQPRDLEVGEIADLLPGSDPVSGLADQCLAQLDQVQLAGSIVSPRVADLISVTTRVVAASMFWASRRSTAPR